MSKLNKKVVYSGQIILKTGLHIGGTNTALNIGGPDSFVVRNPLTNIPYIPGSLGALRIEISPPPTRDGSPSSPLSSRVCVSDTTCTARSDYSDRVCHLHSVASCGVSLLSAR